MSNKKLIRNSTAEFLIFTGQAGEQSIEARYEDETLWLSQKLMAELVGVDVRTVSEHLKNIFVSQELTAEAVIRKFRITASDGKNYQTQFYNLDAIISVGYRVNSLRATQFRQWATGVLREFAIKGYPTARRFATEGKQNTQYLVSVSGITGSGAVGRQPPPAAPDPRQTAQVPDGTGRTQWPQGAESVAHPEDDGRLRPGFATAQCSGCSADSAGD